MSLTFRFLFLLSGLACSSLPAPAANPPWPLWRGDPAMTGVSSESLTFPLKPAWKFTAAKPIKATAVADASRAYLGDGKGVFYALNLTDGAKAWEFTTKDSIEGSALLSANDVIFGSADGFVYCLEAATGKLRWKFETEAEIRGGANLFVREGQEPLVLIGSYDNRLYALKASDGSIAWRTPRDTKAPKKFSFCTPAVIPWEGKTQIISPFSDAVAAYDPADGRELWRIRYTGYSVIAQPAFGNGLIYFTTSYDAPVTYAVRPGGSGDVTDTHVAWTQAKNSPNTPTPSEYPSPLLLVHGVGDARHDETDDDEGRDVPRLHP